MSSEALEKEAVESARKHVMNMLQRPGQLEKVEQFKRRVCRKKASVEAMLKATLQSQLDGVSTGLGHIHQSLQHLDQVKQNISSMNKMLESVPRLVTQLQSVREKTLQHSQYMTAVENLKSLFTVPDSVEKTKQWINDGKLLYAHHSLNDLENTRDDMLYEIHRIPGQNPSDRILLKAWFEDVEIASQLLEKQLKLVLSRTLNTVRKEPTIIVTALRIVDKEEKKDVFAIQRHKASGFMPPGRPKKWKNMTMEVLEASINQRIEGTQVEDRATNKMWLVVHLELTRQLIIEDFRVIKSLCEPCFPPQYNIVQKFITMYHNALSKHLLDIINNGLEGNEYVSMLAWVKNTYPDLLIQFHNKIDPKQLEPLLPESVVTSLEKQYLKNMEDNYTEWMQKTLETEQSDWTSEVVPEGDQDGYYHTAAPVIIFQMIDQNLQVAKTISRDLTDEALTLSMRQVTKYGRLYRDAIIKFKSMHFNDRNQVPLFTHYMITIVNNCLLYIELAQQMSSDYFRKDLKAVGIFADFKQTFQDLRDVAAQLLLEEAFLDCDSHFQDLLSPKWLSTSIPMDTVCLTLEDYFQDYIHLRKRNYEYVITEAENLAAKNYLSSLLQKKVSFRSFDERRSAGSKIVKEMEQMKQFFSKFLSKVTARIDSPFDALDALAEVLKSEDSEILSLDLRAFVDKYPDVKEEQLVKFLNLRGDISKSEIRELVSYTLKSSRASSRKPFTKSIFQILP